ncbi:hypothetical protein [Streptomyces sp. CAU 1734]|uniref:hypothetical protein n=1 Tax=Streptomyces sp. CAU 1734 TaxID=3140360 RepID=UPI0032610198
MTENPDPHELRARLHRLMAARYRLAAAEQDAAAEMVITTKAMKDFVATWNAAVARDIAQHPDLAELNVTLDGYYGPEPNP